MIGEETAAPIFSVLEKCGTISFPHNHHSSISLFTCHDDNESMLVLLVIVVDVVNVVCVVCR